MTPRASACRAGNWLGGSRRPAAFQKENKVDFQIDQAALLELAAQKIADQAIDRDQSVIDDARRMIETRVAKIFAEKAESAVQDAIDAAVSDALHREYRQTNGFGEPKGEATTISKELEKLASGYWSARVSQRTGKPTDSAYDSISRAEYVMVQACGEQFSDQMKTAGVSMTAALKDGLRAQLAVKVDGLLDELFRVKSLQDQGKATKPW